jgi:hypothetical protein
MMRKAGFYIDDRWMDINKTSQTKTPCNCGKLIYWTNSKGILITIFDYEQISLKKLVAKIIDQTERNMKKKAYVAWCDPV